jgi:hypothetical protein
MSDLRIDPKHPVDLLARMNLTSRTAVHGTRLAPKQGVVLSALPSVAKDVAKRPCNIGMPP